MTESQLDPETLRGVIARELTGARQRTTLLTDSVDEADLVRQHSPLMSPLVWDLAHIVNQEELWLLREVGGRDPIHPEIDPLYDAFEHPRAERPTLPLLPAAMRPRLPPPLPRRPRPSRTWRSSPTSTPATPPGCSPPPRWC